MVGGRSFLMRLRFLFELFKKLKEFFQKEEEVFEKAFEEFEKTTDKLFATFLLKVYLCNSIYKFDLHYANNIHTGKRNARFPHPKTHSFGR